MRTTRSYVDAKGGGGITYAAAWEICSLSPLPYSVRRAPWKKLIGEWLESCSSQNCFCYESQMMLPMKHIHSQTQRLLTLQQPCVCLAFHVGPLHSKLQIVSDLIDLTKPQAPPTTTRHHHGLVFSSRRSLPPGR